MASTFTTGTRIRSTSGKRGVVRRRNAADDPRYVVRILWDGRARSEVVPLGSIEVDDSAAASAPAVTVKWTHLCPSHPNYPADAATHECMAKEMRCAYCGVRIDPYPCNGCGKFLNAETMHADEGGRCAECV